MPLADTTAQREAIIRAAKEMGMDPATALAVAQRESAFNPNARSSKTIAGMYQMRGDLRQQYGVGDTKDPYAQAKGWIPFFNDTKSTMSKALGRPVTDAEGYAGHHFGAGRAARMYKMDPSTPVDQVFSPYERSINPHFDKAGTVGNLLGSVTGDIDKRRASFGGADTASGSPLDLSGFETASADQPKDVKNLHIFAPKLAPDTGPVTQAQPLDLGGFEPVEAPAPTQTASAQPLDLSGFEPAA